MATSSRKALAALLSRRQALRWIGATGVAGPMLGAPIAKAVATGPAGTADSPRGLPTRAKNSVDNHVAVIGAGLAGLAAAWELRGAGHRVTVVEATARPGGRVRTAHDPFAGELYSEVGAVAFSDAYAQANRYIDALELERRDFVFSPLPQLYHLRGRRFSHAPDTRVDWPYELTPEERELGPGGLLARYVLEGLPDLDDPDDWRQPDVLQLDQLSLKDVMRRRGASADAVRLLENVQYFTSDPERASALSVALADVGLFFRGQGLFVLAGGNDSLPQAMASRLRPDVRYGVEVTGLSADDGQVEIHGRQGGTSFQLAADYAVVTVPATVLRFMEIKPALPEAQRRAIEALPYRDVIRAQVQLSSGFWHDQGVSGGVITDLFTRGIERQPYFDAGASSRRAILEAFFEGPTALRLQDRSHADIMTHALEQMERAHPEVRGFVEGSHVYAWGDDPFARGAYSWPGPGDVTRCLEALQQPNGRIHFAGEHTSPLRATMEGALRSGLRAANEIEERAARAG